MTAPWVIKIFSWFWKRRLDKEDRDTVVVVTGWRSCIIDNKWGSRKRVVFLLRKHG